ncbi:ras-related protein RabC [Lingula anatina]|uniref:Ras-related protein RabC n=1 Tax=Lingula anatina TaxID=7574 RepID=A0A1S3KCK8_LINAN|nr:ras-related protein RabC [Lingula anatina]|eukprot:XP_013420368.1 ras-related protein RabC [Lingula anatina]
MASVKGSKTSSKGNSILLKNRVFLTKNLHADEVIELLLQERKLARSEYDDIVGQTTRENKVKKLLDILGTKDHSAYSVFRKGLEEGECDQRFIIEKLDKAVSQTAERRLKVIFLGATESGKTSLLDRYVDDKFLAKTAPTLGPDYRIKTVNSEDFDESVKLQLWDCPGKGTYISMSRTYYRAVDAIILVYDVTRKKTFEEVRHFLQDFYNNSRGCDDAVIMLIGNKQDLVLEDNRNKREVEPIEASEFAKQHDIDFTHETSAKTGANVEAVFRILINEMCQRNAGKADDSDIIHLQSDKHRREPLVNCKC